MEKKTPKAVLESLDSVIQEKLLQERKVFLWGEVNDRSAREVIERLFYLELLDSGKEITFYINTPGGSITAGMSIYDTIKLIRSPVTIIVTGMAASMGSILLCAAEQGRRYLYPHARVLLHQPLLSGQMVGPATDLHIQAQEMEKLRHESNQILAKASGQPLSKIQADTDRDFYLTAEEAIQYGLADKVITDL